MDSTTNSTSNDQYVAMQQRIVQLEQMLAQTASQSSTEQQPSDNSTTLLHLVPFSISSEILQLDSSLFPTKMLTDEERKKLIDQYPNIDNLHYQTPDTIPTAARKMNKYQTKQDMSFKRLQYLLSGIFRPLDVLGLEISQEVNNPNVQRYLYMLKDCRALLLNVSAQINDMRNNIAFQAINPYFSTSNIANNNKFTMSPIEFQEALVQQSTTTKAIRSAISSVFRSGPSSQQGGYPNYNKYNNNGNTSNHNSNYDSSNNYIGGSGNSNSSSNSSNYKGRNTRNPFRNNQQ
ncbi:hypothetical protein BDA99DRAFT_545887 [Phascolomyces articulosus]|uniref:Uncharacterized protein n=1 Tax=Phascolomyces articulosus TaxID=60185 RepID=A0AAD5KI50_9FUNG|nr:hypothetical protein BDA99DRAFT_545887 [Phascolomyces articulosus]